MPQLFLSLGTSPAIAFEAVLLPEESFDAVHIITSHSPRVSTAGIHAFFQHRGLAYSITRVRDFTELFTIDDHIRFEETLLRWLVARLLPLPREERWVCLAGGFKTISAAMQQAAELLGAAQVFHVLAEPIIPDGARLREPATPEEVQQAIHQGTVHWVPLGSQPGWPHFQGLRAEDFPLEVEPTEHPHEFLAAPADPRSLRESMAAVRQCSQYVSAHLESWAALPFPVLAAWPPEEVAWLHEPVDPVLDRGWVARIPKMDLHCHLGGFATHGPLLEAVRAAAQHPEGLPSAPPPPVPPDWPLPPEPIGLARYTALGDATGSALLADPGCLHRHCQLLHQALAEDRVVYAEIRCSPANYARGRSPWEVLADIRAAFQDGMERGLPHVNLILVATRREGGDFRAHMTRHLALAVTAAEVWRTGCRVVGVDLAGYERPETRAHLFREEFTAVHRCGLALTVHAGENDDAEGIWRAVFDLNARRLGHALHLGRSESLLRSVAERRIAVELCPYANYQIRHPFPGSQPHEECYQLDGAPAERAVYPLKKYLKAGVAVTLNSDNLGISAATLTDNWLLAARLCPGITRMELLTTLRHSLEAAFVDHGLRQRLLQEVSAGLPRPPRPR